MSHSKFGSKPCQHYVKSVQIRSFSGNYFPVFGLSTDKSPYSVLKEENADQKNGPYLLTFHVVQP